MYPDDAMTAYYVDEIMDACMDIQRAMAKTFAMKGLEQKIGRSNLFEKGGFCLEVTECLEARVKNFGKAYSVADHLTVADVVIFTWLNTLRCGFLDFVDKGFLSKFPTLDALCTKIAAHPQVAAYYASDKVPASCGAGTYACFKPGWVNSEKHIVYPESSPCVASVMGVAAALFVGAAAFRKFV